jgi:2-oxoglutarate ferredoxin oxidoreductase subunit beta
VGSTSKRGQVNKQTPIDPVLLALTLGATFVARSFSGDKRQLVPILKAGLLHDGFALVDVISPCVSFNDHEGSTKSYQYTRAHSREVAGLGADELGIDGGSPSEDFVPLRREITAETGPGAVTAVPMHDGTVLRFRAVGDGYDATDRDAAAAHVRALQARGEIATGVLHVDPKAAPSMHRLLGTVEGPLTELPFESLCPGRAALDELMGEMR